MAARKFTGNIDKDCQRIALDQVRKTGNKVLRRAKKYSKGPYSKARPDSLANMMSLVTARVPGSVGAQVICFSPVASVVEGGARAHKITPHHPPDYLKFFWRKAGHVVWFTHVNHPGMQGKRFLSRALVEVAKTDGYWVKYVRI